MDNMDQHLHLHQHQVEELPCVPPGFRFHPTEEELVGYYLARKVASQTQTQKQMDLDIIQEVDLYRIEPWDLQERCKPQHGGDEHTTEWYFFSYKDRKYPSGTRTNRATAAGFWKATGRDKPVLSSSSSSTSRCRSGSRVIGMRKTLVFYRGRAPNGRKSDWIMHEYRLQSNDHAPAQEEGWVVCRAFQKPIPNQQQQMRSFFPTGYSYSHSYSGSGYYDQQHLHLSATPTRTRLTGSSSALPLLHLPAAVPAPGGSSSFVPPWLYSDDDDDLLLESKKHLQFSTTPIPPLESPTAAIAAAPCCSDSRGGYDDERHDDELMMIRQGQGQGQCQGGGGEQADVAAAAGSIDWNFLDSLLSATSQLQP